MLDGMTTRPSRRTQTERRAHTRQALLDATFTSLVERGYASTSTNDIIRLAGVSRGAMLHHFASRAELMASAVEHVFDRCEMEFRESFAALPVEQRTLDKALEQLWVLFRGPTFDAALELVVAARTEPELRDVLHGVLTRFRRNVQADFGVLFPATATQEDGPLLLELAFAVLEGAAINHDVGFVAEAEGIVALLRAITRDVIDNPAARAAARPRHDPAAVAAGPRPTGPASDPTTHPTTHPTTDPTTEPTGSDPTDPRETGGPS
jgi:AcrR family transcriptional regulator